KDGRRLISMVSDINRIKPVVVWKGGLTSSGARAAASHTGSLAGNRLIWDAFFRQTGAIRVNSVEEMAEVCLALMHLKPSAGKRVAVLGAGGGSSVATGDTCAEEGLEMPLLSEHTRARFLEFISLVNQGVMNPLDIPSVVLDFKTLKRVFDLLDSDPVVDVVIMNLGAEFYAGLIVPALSQFKEVVAGSRKPVVISVTDEGQVRDTETYVRALRQGGLLAYSSLQKACRAIRRFAEYQEFLEGR
ncbi:MAG: hypothetical protein IBX68_01380, partial [Dehalococcoidia bacterium]|nr:hypothetical protein [Dehalococcoidia bacterium]